MRALLKHILIWGSITALVSGIYAFVQDAISIQESEMFMYYAALTLVIMLVGVSVTIVKYQNKQARKIKFYEGLLIGAITGFLVSTIFIAYSLIRNEYLSDVLKIKSNEEYVTEYMLKEGKTQAEIDRRILEMQSSSYTTYILFIVIRNQVVYCTVFAVLTMLFMRTKSMLKRKYNIKQ